MVHVWAFDPGETTGWCHISVHEGDVGVFDYGEYDHVSIGNLLFDNQCLRAAVSKLDIIEMDFVVEKYVMNSKITQSPWSLEITGLIRYFAKIYNVPITFVTPSSHKNLISNDVIKRAGLWVPGKGHAMDAVRMCLWYTITKHKLLTQFLKEDIGCPKANTNE